MIKENDDHWLVSLVEGETYAQVLGQTLDSYNRATRKPAWICPTGVLVRGCFRHTLSDYGVPVCLVEELEEKREELSSGADSKKVFVFGVLCEDVDLVDKILFVFK